MILNRTQLNKINGQIVLEKSQFLSEIKPPTRKQKHGTRKNSFITEKLLSFWFKNVKKLNQPQKYGSRYPLVFPLVLDSLVRIFTYYTLLFPRKEFLPRKRTKD